MQSTYYMKKGDTVSCMRCKKDMVLTYEPDKCCKSETDAFHNMCGCRGVPEPVFCDKCWEEIENEYK